jgi:hypothetical protein
MVIDRDRLPEFPMLVRQATNPDHLIQQILERVNSFSQKVSDRMTPQECKRFINSLYNGGTISQWPSIPRAAIAQVTPVAKGLVAEIKHAVHNILGNPKKCPEWAMIQAVASLSFKTKTTSPKSECLQKMAMSAMALTLQHEEAILMDELETLAKTRGVATNARIHDGIVLYNMQIPPADLVSWLTTKMASKIERGEIPRSITAVTHPKSLYKLKIEDEDWYKWGSTQEQREAQTWLKTQAEAWTKCITCAAQMDNTSKTKECSVCVDNRVEAKKWAKGKEAQSKRATLLGKYVSKFWKCKCGNSGDHTGDCSEGIGFYPAYKAVEQLASERMARSTARKTAQVLQTTEATVSKKVTKSDRFTTTNIHAHSGTRVRAR